jgi:hypothetical protein
MTGTPSRTATRRPSRRSAKLLRSPAAIETGVLQATETSQWSAPQAETGDHARVLFALAVACIGGSFGVASSMPNLVLPLHVLGVCLCLRGVMIAFTSANRLTAERASKAPEN